MTLDITTQAVETLKPLEVLDAYTLRNPSEVRAFISQRPHLRALLREAPREIAKFFPGAPLSLEVICDPDSDGHGELVLSIRTQISGRQAFETMKAFDREWRAAHSREARQGLLVTLEWA